MKRLLALLMAVLMGLSLLTACGTETAPVQDGTTPTEDGQSDENTPESEVPPVETPPADPYDAVKNYWSADQLTQEWGPEQVVEHLFFHPIIAFPK